jgi:hypothetical protein
MTDTVQLKSWLAALNEDPEQAKEWTALGHTVRFRFMYDYIGVNRGPIAGLHLIHWDEAKKAWCGGRIPFFGHEYENETLYWTFTSLDPLTVTEPVQCGCGKLFGNITAGAWVPGDPEDSDLLV